MRNNNTDALRNLTGLTALITGGSSGIGLALAKALCARGVKVGLVATDAKRLADAVSAIQELGGTAFGTTLDVRDAAHWPLAVKAIEDALGPIQLLFLNAGAQGGRKPVEEIGLDEWKWVWDVNVDGVFLGLKTCLPAMKARGLPAHIMATGSAAGMFPRPMSSAYGAAKGAVLALFEALALELADSPISTSVLSPAIVRTGMNETMKRHAPAASDNEYAWMDQAINQGRDADQVAEDAINQMQAGNFYILTHPEVASMLAATQQNRLDAIAANARLADEAGGNG
jgi:NADP-dependent 3-hydroxy acid dehydrogenase YdfG